MGETGVGAGAAHIHDAFHDDGQSAMFYRLKLSLCIRPFSTDVLIFS